MTPSELAWTFEHSVNCAVSVKFAWQFWTNVQNWTLDSDVESVELSGPFAEGTRGVTNSRAAGRIEWRIAEIGDGRAVIEFPFSGAMGRCVWEVRGFCWAHEDDTTLDLARRAGCQLRRECCSGVGDRHPCRHEEAVQDDGGCGSVAALNSS